MVFEIIQNIVNRTQNAISWMLREEYNERISYNQEKDEIHENPTFKREEKCETPFFAPGHP